MSPLESIASMLEIFAAAVLRPTSQVEDLMLAGQKRQSAHARKSVA
ncbi:hypothetical protein PAMC26577_19150 [Caballeronia sordidicola]|uniref:Uncharacterized protein n=1 Tax=Caballeronia sordidicola TaxID=196367 RepID=A0A242MP25_CABSO|nr:hypothetical protein PAMC26577_19150 [Caballeronia sordidicola]